MAMKRPKTFIDPKTGKLTVDGRTMSRETYFKIYGDIFKSSAEKLKETKKISSTPVSSKPKTKKEAKAVKKAAKKAEKTLKKVDKANYSSTAAAARAKAAERAKLVPPDKRTPAQVRAIKTETRYKNNMPGYSKGPESKKAKEETKAFNKESKRIAAERKAKRAEAAKAARGTTGRGRFGRGGAGLGGMFGIKNR